MLVAELKKLFMYDSYSKFDQIKNRYICNRRTKYCLR